jgi:hypothetical protein
MKSMRFIGMAITLLSFIGFLGIGCLAGLTISVASDGRGMTWGAFKERLPTFLALAAFLVTLGLLVYVVIVVMRYYGA